MPRISDLFVLDYGHSLELNRLTPSSDSHAINFVGRAARNNGVTARVAPIPNLQPAAAGTITVALNGQGGAGVAFLQPFPFYTGFHIMVLSPKEPMPEIELLWWAMCITANRFRFGFGRQANRTLKDLMLPARGSMPAWVVGTDLDKFKGAQRPAHMGGTPNLEPTKWKPFPIQDLFDLRKGKRLTRADIKGRPGPVPFIGAVDSNNGVAGAVDAAIHDANTITVNYNGSVAEAFYQPVAFWASDDVNVLYPKFDLTPAVALFISTVIRLEKYRFSYGRKWHLERMRDSVIRLPSLSSGQPDLPFMQKYIESLPFGAEIDPAPSR